MEARRTARTLGIFGSVLVVVLPIALAVWIIPGWVSAELAQDDTGIVLGMTFALGIPYFVASWLMMAAGTIAVVGLVALHHSRLRPGVSTILFVVAGLLGLSPLLLLGHDIAWAPRAQISLLPSALFFVAAWFQLARYQRGPQVVQTVRE